MNDKKNIFDHLYSFSKRVRNNKLLFKHVFSNETILKSYGNSWKSEIEKIILENKVDLIQVEQPMSALPVFEVAEKHDIPTIVDFHGIWCEELNASGFLQYSDSGYKVIQNFEKLVSKKADMIVAVSEEMRDYIMETFNIDSKRVVVVPNASFVRRSSPAENLVGYPRVIHAGTLHSWENVELFVESMPYIKEQKPNVEFYLTKKGDKLGKVIKMCDELKLNPKFTWFENEAEFFEFLQSCDVGVISSTPHIARKMAYPAKLYDYLSVGLPIVANDIGSWSKSIENNQVGIVTESDPEDYAKGIVTLLNDADLRKRCSINGVNLIKDKWNYNESAKLLYNIYLKLVN